MLLILDDTLVPPRAFDELGAAQVGLLLLTPLAVLGLADAVPVALTAPASWCLAAVGVALLARARQQRAYTAWARWAGAFEARVPGVVAALETLAPPDRLRAGTRFAEQLLGQAHRIPALPGNAGHRGAPHGARLLHWVAARLGAASPLFGRGVQDVARQHAESAVHEDG